MPGDLHVRNGRVRAFLAGESREVQVVYRRTDEDRLSDEGGRATWLADLLLDPCRSGHVTCVNAFGTGVADDKLVHAYVDDMIRFYLGEEPPVESVRTYDLGHPETRDLALSRVADLVVKPRDGHGGHGIFIGAHATAEDRAAVARRVSARPDDWVAQETVLLSRHPIVQGGALVPRHVDLRAFVVSTADAVSVAPGGLTRFAGAEGSLVVNSSQGGGGKDTWVLR
jgi:carboxylate-amine ligase